MEKEVLKITDINSNEHFINFDALVEVYKNSNSETVFVLQTGTEIKTSSDFNLIKGFIQNEAIKVYEL